MSLKISSRHWENHTNLEKYVKSFHAADAFSNAEINKYQKIAGHKAHISCPNTQAGLDFWHSGR
jgi:hypothetical protein